MCIGQFCLVLFSVAAKCWDASGRLSLSDGKAGIVTAQFRAASRWRLSRILGNLRCRPCAGSLCPEALGQRYEERAMRCQAISGTAVLRLCQRTPRRAAYYPQPLSTVTKRWPSVGSRTRWGSLH